MSNFLLSHRKGDENFENRRQYLWIEGNLKHFNCAPQKGLKMNTSKVTRCSSPLHDIAVNMGKYYTLQSLTDGLCCTHSYSSHSHHILSSHWHTVIAWGRIWGGLKGVATPPICAPGNVHTLSNHNRPRLENDPVLHMVPTWAWTCLPWVNWVLERDKILINTANLKLHCMYVHNRYSDYYRNVIFTELTLQVPN